MKKLILALLTTTALTVSAMETVILVNPYKPGGGGDQITQVLKPILEKNGVVIETLYTKSCEQGLKILKENKKNSLLIVHSSSYGTDCIVDHSKDNIDLFSSMTNTSTYLCSSPGKTITDLAAPGLRIGTTADSTKVYLDLVLKNFKVAHSIKVVPYNTSGEVARAATVGDIDLWFASGPSDRLIAAGASCFAASTKDNLRGYPYIGSLTTKENKFLELPSILALFQEHGNIDPKVKTAFVSAFQSEEFKSFLLDRKSTHSGIGTNGDTKRDFELIKKIATEINAPK